MIHNFCFLVGVAFSYILKYPKTTKCWQFANKFFQQPHPIHSNNFASQILYCKSITYHTPSQNTLLFSWNIPPLHPTFALLSKAGPGPLNESQIILTAVGIATASRKNERQ
jgi:hypothetical protein